MSRPAVGVHPFNEYRRVKLATHLHLMTRLRISEAVSLLPRTIRVHIVDRDNVIFFSSFVSILLASHIEGALTDCQVLVRRSAACAIYLS